MKQHTPFPRTARRPAWVISGLGLAVALAACSPSGGAPGAQNHLAGNPAQATTAYQPLPATGNAPAPDPRATYPQAAYPQAPYQQVPQQPAPSQQAPYAPAQPPAPAPRQDNAARYEPAPVVQPVQSSQRPAPSAVYGQISSIEPITQTPQTSGAGAVVGGVLGAVVGNQIGSGNGRAAATVLGGVGGAVLGNKVEKSRSSTVVGYRVHVQLDNGGTRSFERRDVGGLEVGSRVRVDGGRLRSA